MDEVLPAALAARDPGALLRAGDHTIEDIYEVPPPPPAAVIAELTGPTGVN
jgi:hypothetical protein